MNSITAVISTNPLPWKYQTPYSNAQFLLQLYLLLSVLAPDAIMLLTEQMFSTTFFGPAEGGDSIFCQHLLWFSVHAEAYVLVLTEFGIVSHAVPYDMGEK